LKLSSDPSLDALKSCINTRQGERVLRPTYGADLDTFVTVSDIGLTTAELILTIEADMLEYQPFYTQVESTVDDDGEADITIFYSTTETYNSTLKYNANTRQTT
jgi:phage baseplate assembly protein W